VKLMYCAHCEDVVRLFPEKRSCRCGRSWGHYLEDNSTTVQTWPSLSLGIANPDFVQAESAFGEHPDTFSPIMSMRCWINPASEPDVKFVAGIPMQAEDAESEVSTTRETEDPDLALSTVHEAGPVATG
jgi:hypothetical protein